ncbi:MAG: hypothetical protein AB1942_11060 [Pseudomonadota bacterium]
MADGDLTLKVELKLSEAAARQLRARAAKLGVSLDDAAADVIEQTLFDYDAYDWGDDPSHDPRAAMVAEAGGDELTYPAEEVLADFRTELERRVAAKQ